MTTHPEQSKACKSAGQTYTLVVLTHADGNVLISSQSTSMFLPVEFRMWIGLFYLLEEPAARRTSAAGTTVEVSAS